MMASVIMMYMGRRATYEVSVTEKSLLKPSTLSSRRNRTLCNEYLSELVQLEAREKRTLKQL